MIRFLVTGAGGFVGGAVMRCLGSAEIPSVGLVRRPGRNADGTESYICADILDEGRLARLLSKEAFDAVIDAAAVIPKASSEKASYQDNVRMTEALLRCLAQRPPRYFLKLSTADVYGAPNSGDKITEQTATVPRTFYAKSQSESEGRVEAWAKRFSVPACIVRLTQVFGPGDPTRKFIPQAIRSIKNESLFRLHGDGSERRDYLYVEDAAKLICACARKRTTRVLNLATGESRSLLDVLQDLRQVAKITPEIRRLPRRKPAVDHEFDVTALVKTLGKVPLTPFKRALRKTYDAFSGL